MGYNIWASKIKDWVDWCPRAAFLKSMGLKEKNTEENVYNFLLHDMYETIYVEKWDAIKKQEIIDANYLSEKALNIIDGLIDKKWDDTILPALKNESKQKNKKEFTEDFKNDLDIEKIQNVCNMVEYAINWRIPSKIDYIAECNEWDLLKSTKYGIGARPDFILCLDERNLMISDVKKKITKGGQLQNAAAYIVLEENKEYIAEKFDINPRESTVLRKTLFENYSTGEEVNYTVTDKDIEEVLYISKNLRRKNNIPEKDDVCSFAKEDVCSFASICIDSLKLI